MQEHVQARFIVETLNKAGFIAYYAGGWVRDLLLNHPSDDIDIATNAPPETVQALFPRTIPIGIAFGIILVLVDGHQYEVATFRQDFDYRDGRRPSQIQFSSPVEDAKRRDFTINGMFYDPVTEKIFDYVEGQADLKAKIIRAIGNPHERIREDRLRMIRAIRLACRFNFQIEPQTESAIRAHAKELCPAVAIERIWQELTKGHTFGKLHPMLLQMHAFGLLSAIFPSLEKCSFSEIKERLSPIQHYPPEAPLITFILPLFSETTLPEQMELCQFLKLSNHDRQLVTFLFQAKRLLLTAEERFEWAHFYAHPWADLALQIFDSLEKHEERKRSLREAILRIREKNPLVKSADLLQAGVKPGIGMGKLLKAAERIAINEQKTDPSQVIEQLKKSSLWPDS